MPAICTRGGPSMATAGMGDVLTGTIAGVLAQCGDLWQAAQLGVVAHACAGERAAAGRERGLLATDLMSELPACLN